MEMSHAQAEEAFDSLMGSSTQYEHTERKYATVSIRENQDDSLPFDRWNFLDNLGTERKKVFNVFDIVENWVPPSPGWDASSLDNIAESIKTNGESKAMDLPTGLRPPQCLPAGTRMSLIVCPPHDGAKRHVIKFISFTKPIHAKDVQPFISGKA